MEDEAVTQFDAIIGFQHKACVGEIFVILLGGEGVGSEKAVVAHMPTGGVTEAGGVVEDGDTDDFVLNGAVVRDPFGRFGPCVVIGLTFGVDDMAAFAGLYGHRSGNADVESSVLFVVDFDVTTTGDEILIEIDDALAVLHTEGELAFLTHELVAVDVDIITDREDACVVFIGSEFGVFAMFDGADGGKAFAVGFTAFGVIDSAFKGGFFRPAVESADAFMAEADATLMDVVLIFTFDVLHRIIAGHGFAGGAIDRPEERLVALIDDVFGERFALMKDADVVVGKFFNAEAFGGFVGGG